MAFQPIADHIECPDSANPCYGWRTRRAP